MRMLLFAVLFQATPLLATAAHAQQAAWKQVSTFAGALPPAGEQPQDPLAALKERARKDRESRPLFLVTESDLEGKPRLHLVIRFDQLEEPYIFNSTIERGTGERDVHSTLMDDTFLFSFRRSGEKVQLLRRRTDYRADAGTPELKAIEKSIPGDILAVVPIELTDAAAGYLVISAEDLFLQDITRIGLQLQQGNNRGKTLRYAREESSFARLAAFPGNVEAQVQLLFVVADPTAGPIEEGMLAVTMRYSLTSLPQDSSFEPRPADARVGYFTTDFQDLSRGDLKHLERPMVHLINRWNIEKKDPGAPVSEVKKPVVFWLEDTIPEEHRPAVKAGILAWNEAFEAVGIRNVIQVKEVDKDLSPAERASFDPADIAYNMVRWFVGENARFAIGPSRVSPLTGEIFNASISVGDIMGRVFSVLDLVPERPTESARTEGSLLDRARKEAAVGLGLLEAGAPSTFGERKRFIQEFLTEAIAHETGHTLGLCHNFEASRMLPQGELGKDGLLSSSVMDYNPPNIAPLPSSLRPQYYQSKLSPYDRWTVEPPQEPYYQTKVGPYDRWAVEYGYKPLAGNEAAREAELDAIASRSSSDTRLAYATDGEVGGLDPDVQRFDLGSEALPFARSRVGLARAVWGRLETEAEAPDADPRRLGERFNAAFRAYFLAVKSVLPVIGGVRTRRGPGRRFAPVSAAEQRAALAFIEEQALSPGAFLFSPRLLQSLGNDLRGMPAVNLPFPVGEAVANLQGLVLDHLFSPATLRRLLDREVFSEEPRGSFSPSEMLDRVRRSIWGALTEGEAGTIHPYDRDLQARHIAALNRVSGDQSVPSDARAAARRDLNRIFHDIEQALSTKKWDEASELHLQAMLGRPVPRRTLPTEGSG